MKAADAIKARIEQLVAESGRIMRTNEHNVLVDERALGDCIGWISAAVVAVEAACASSPTSAYVRQAEAIRAQAATAYYAANTQAQQLVSLLRQLLVDLSNGLLISIERQVSAETFDDLLDHAEAYLNEGRKEPAGVLTGVVFEDTVRRLCRANGVNEAGMTLDPMINALKTANVITKLEGKEAVAAAGLRTSATHALWHEFDAPQVTTVIGFTRRLIREKLAA